jgi:hypothetical protein
VQTIDDLFSHAAKNAPGATLVAGHSSQLLGILNLLKDVPDELITLTSADYSELIFAKSTIEEHLAHWRARGDVGSIANVKGFDVVTVIRRALAKCPDEYPASATTELLFINDGALRENIRRDLGASNRALNNAEWKAATVLAGAAIEALLHWRLQEPSPGPAAIQTAVTALVASGTISKPDSNIDRWELLSSRSVLRPMPASARISENLLSLVAPNSLMRVTALSSRSRCKFPS